MSISRRAFLLMPVASIVREYSPSQSMSELERCIIEQKVFGNNRNSLWNIYIIRMLMAVKITNEIHDELLKLHKDSTVMTVKTFRATEELGRRLRDVSKAFKAYKQFV